jgi:hypothetical protein
LAAALTNTIKSAVEDYPVELESVWICVLNPLPELLRANVVPLLQGCSTASNGQIVETTLFRLYEFVRTDAEMRRTFSALGDRFDSPVAAIPTFVDAQWEVLGSRADCSKAHCIRAWLKWFVNTQWSHLEGEFIRAGERKSIAANMFHNHSAGCSLDGQQYHDVHPHDKDFGTTLEIIYDAPKYEKSFVKSFICVWSQEKGGGSLNMSERAAQAINFSIGPPIPKTSR